MSSSLSLLCGLVVVLVFRVLVVVLGVVGATSSVGCPFAFIVVGRVVVVVLCHGVGVMVCRGDVVVVWLHGRCVWLLLVS